MDRNLDTPIASSDAEAGSNLPPGPVVQEKSGGGKLWLFIALVVAAVLVYLAKGMI